MIEALRTCIDCGLEAITKEDLNLFVKDSAGSHGRRNLCGTCVNKRNRKRYAENDEFYLRRVYRGMIRRCYFNQSHDFINYGGRGISVRPNWIKNPEAFIKWALENGFQRGLYIDRRDNDGDYSPENCRWVSRSVNNRNKRNIVTNFEKETRVCSICGLEKPLSNFHIGRYRCKQCVSNSDRARYRKKKIQNEREKAVEVLEEWV